MDMFITILTNASYSAIRSNSLGRSWSEKENICDNLCWR